MADEAMNLADARAYAVAAERSLAEAAAIRKSAEADLEAAKHERGQAEHRRREIAQIEKSVAERELRLAQHNEAELVAREQAAEAKLAEVRDLLSQYSADRHGAAIALQQINAREQAERS